MGANDMKNVLRGGLVLPLSLSCLAIAVFLGLLAPGAFADVNGRIRGTVSDASGAAVVDASVKIVNISTSLERALTTTDVGTFDAPNLPPGTYTVPITKTRFWTFKQTRIKPEQPATFWVSPTPPTPQPPS